MTDDVASQRIRADLRHAREMLLDGRGPGASEEEIAAHTRNRVEIARVPITRRRELAGRQTSLARGDTDAVTDVIELNRAELADALDKLGERLNPQRLGRVAAHALRRKVQTQPAGFVIGGAALVLLLLRRRHPSRPTTR